MQRASSHRRMALKALTVGLAAPALALAADPVLVLATGAREPMVSSPGKPGFIEELAREALRRAGYGLRVVPLPVERALQNANAGIEDGDLGRAAGFEKDYPNLIQVPQPLLELDFVAMSRRADVDVRGWPGLARYSVGYVTGSKLLERQLQGVAEQTSVRDDAALFALLAADRVDVVLIYRWGGYVAARQAGLAVRVHEPALLRVPVFIYLHRRHASLAPQLATALGEVRQDGTWQRLYDQIIRPLEPAR